MKIVDLELTPDVPLHDYVSLTDVALRRKIEPERGIYLAESLKVLGRALDAGHQPLSVLTQAKWLPELEPILNGHDIPVYVASPEFIENITGFDVHRGVIASMSRPEMPPLDSVLDGATRVVILENIVDHTNVGAIFRSVAAVGADAVLVTPECADPLYRRSVRVSMGTVFQVPWARLPSWPSGIADVKKLGFTVAALALDDRAVSMRDFASEEHPKIALVLGTEGHGLLPETLAECDRTVMIPMKHGIDSLNVAAAGAVALYAIAD